MNKLIDTFEMIYIFLTDYTLYRVIKHIRWNMEIDELARKYLPPKRRDDE